MKFDLSEFAELSNAAIREAKLELYSSGKYDCRLSNGSKNLPNRTKSLYLAPKIWEEGSITWNSYGDNLGNMLSTVTNSGFDLWESFDVLSAVKDMVSGKSPNNGFIVKFVPEGYYKQFATSYASSENSDKTVRPRLVITYETDDVHNLSVVNGSGAGNYQKGDTVDIVANDTTDNLPNYDIVFNKWGNGAGTISDAYSKTTTLVMPSTDLNITAKYSKLKILKHSEYKSITASSQNNTTTSKIENAIDDDTTTAWMGKWPFQKGKFPHHFTVTLKDSYKLTGFSYLAKADNKCVVKEYKIEVSSDSSNWQDIYSGVFENLLTKQSLKFKTDVADIRFVRFIALSSYDGKSAGVTEFNLYYDGTTSTSKVFNKLSKNSLFFATVNGSILQIKGPSLVSLNVSIYSLNGKQLFGKSVLMHTGFANIKLPNINRSIVIIKVEGGGFRSIQKLKI